MAMLPTPIGWNELCSAWKPRRISTKTTQTGFPWWQCPGTWNKGDLRIGCILQLGIAGSCSLITRTGTNWLPFICINGDTHSWSSASLFSKMGKMGRWLVQRKTGLFLPGIHKLLQRWQNVNLAPANNFKTKFDDHVFKINVILEIITGFICIHLVHFVVFCNFNHRCWNIGHNVCTYINYSSTTKIWNLPTT